jgi:hypothetical protein
MVTTPSGVEWRIGRRWISRPMPKWRKVKIRPGGSEAAEAALIPDVASLDELAAGVAIAAGVIVVALVLIPLLLFGIELIIVGFVIAAGILGRGLLGRPWVVQATPVDDPAGAKAWKVSG